MLSDSRPACARAQLHAEHRDGVDLEPALRAAEKAVEEKLGYKVSLIEKPLYDPTDEGDD